MGGVDVKMGGEEERRVEWRGEMRVGGRVDRGGGGWRGGVD